MRFCIVGTGRCGSTLLRNMLNMHPETFVFPETHWIPKMYEMFGEQPANPESLMSIVQRTHHVTGKPVTSIESADLESGLGGMGTPTVREFCDRLGQHFAAEAGKKYWADKTPDYGPHMEMLQRLWPDCKFVHLIRDGGAVACSMAKHIGYRWLATAGEDWWGQPSFNGYHTVIEIEERPLQEFAALWYRRITRIRDELTRVRQGSSLEVRFEDLIASPTVLLHEIADFLDLESPEDWIAGAAQQVQPEKIRSRATAEVIGVLTSNQRRLLTDLGYL